MGTSSSKSKVGFEIYTDDTLTQNVTTENMIYYPDLVVHRKLYSKLSKDVLAFENFLPNLKYK